MNEITALAFAAEAHKQHTRKLCKVRNKTDTRRAQIRDRAQHGGAYINHPIRMYERLTEMGAPTVCKMAALLHDTVEDTDVTEEDLYAEFPEEVVYVVMELTDDKSKPKANRKELQVQKAATLSPEAKIVKLVDLWDNCSGLILQNQTWPWDDKRVSKYVAWAYQLHDEIVSSPAHLQNRSSKYTINDVDPVSYTKGAKRKTVTNYRALIDVAAKELVKVLKQY